MNLDDHADHFDTHKAYMECFIEKSAVSTVSCFSPPGGANLIFLFALNISDIKLIMTTKFHPFLSISVEVSVYLYISNYNRLFEYLLSDL